jgi:hypothetical protein
MRAVAIKKGQSREKVAGFQEMGALSRIGSMRSGAHDCVCSGAAGMPLLRSAEPHGRSTSRGTTPKKKRDGTLALPSVF